VSAVILDLAEQRRRRGLPATTPALGLLDHVEVLAIDGLRKGDRVELPDGSTGTIARLEACVDGTARAYVLRGIRNRIIGAHLLRRLTQQANGVRPEA
jgi:hypothetical protein